MGNIRTPPALELELALGYVASVLALPFVVLVAPVLALPFVVLVTPVLALPFVVLEAPVLALELVTVGVLNEENVVGKYWFAVFSRCMI